MSGFIRSLISRHLEPGKNIMPRLRSKFEPPDNPVNNLSKDFSEVRENLTEPIPATVPLSKGTMEITKGTRDISGETGDLSESDYSVSSENKYKIENLKDQSIENSRPLTYRQLPVDEAFPDPPRINVHQLNGSDAGDYTNSTSLNENHIVITHNNKIISDEEVIDKVTTKTPDQSASELPVTTNEALPFTDNREFKNHSGKSAGALGEPPGAISSKKITDDQSLIQNHLDITDSQVIKVSIGQINVRAVSQPSPVAQKSHEEIKPLLSLEDYLKQRNYR